MSVKSLPITEWDKTMLTEPMTHWWKRLDLQYCQVLRSWCLWRHSLAKSVAAQWRLSRQSAGVGLPRGQVELTPRAWSQLCLTSVGTFHFLWVTMADQRMKKIQHPGNDSSSTSTDPKKKMTQHCEEGKQAIYRRYTVDTVWFRHELLEI